MLRPDLYGLDLGELTFHFYLYKIQPTVYMKLCTRLRMREEGERKEGQGASCLTSAGKVTLAGWTTFSHVNNLSRSPETRKLERKMRAHAMSSF